MTNTARGAAVPLAWAVVLLAGAAAAAAQDSVRVVRATAPIRLDGVPDEAVWQTADSITAFTQSDPHEGQPASERTVVRLLAAPTGLYIAVWAYDDEPGAIRHAQLRRDAELESDDELIILLDAQHDLRSGYLFDVNPNGAMRDAEVLSWDEANTDWNGVWDARASITPFGWTAEVWIPWQTLRYRRGAAVWGANFARMIRRKNEAALWRSWHRTEGILFLPAEGTLTGLGDLPGRAAAELRPYVAPADRLPERVFAPSGTDSVADHGVATLKTGLDVKLAPAATATLDLTVNTDFAQVEADRQVLNLTRFPVFFPEQRPFFLEASGNFNFGQVERTSVFTSRRIGLAPDGSPVPIEAGARLSGRFGHERVGVLAVRTGGAEQATDFVARVRHDVFTRGYVGAIVTSQTVPGVRGARLAGGVDASVPLMVHGQNLVLGAWGAASRDSGGAPAAAAWRVTVDFPNDLMDDFVGVSRIPAGYDPALGFVLEADVLRTNGHVDLFPRPHNFLGVRHLHFDLLEWDVSKHVDGSADNGIVGVTPLGADFESGDEFDVTLSRNEDAPGAPFAIFPGDTVAAGHYWWNRAELAFVSSAARPVGLSLTASAGGFYTGTSTAVVGSVTLRAAPHVIATVDLEAQRVRLRAAPFTARVGRLRFDVAATPRIGGTLFLQGDNASDHITLNGRLHWIPSPGSDVYLVYNSAWPTGLPAGVPWSRPERGALIGKVVWYFRL